MPTTSRSLSELRELLADPPRDPLSLLRCTVEARGLLEEIVLAAVAEARADSATWEEIGQALGVTREAAYQRFSRHMP